MAEKYMEKRRYVGLGLFLTGCSAGLIGSVLNLYTVLKEPNNISPEEYDRILKTWGEAKYMSAKLEGRASADINPNTFIFYKVPYEQARGDLVARGREDVRNLEKTESVLYFESQLEKSKKIMKFSLTAFAFGLFGAALIYMKR